jgi:hypothetical protein
VVVLPLLVVGIDVSKPFGGAPHGISPLTILFSAAATSGTNRTFFDCSEVATTTCSDNCSLSRVFIFLFSNDPSSVPAGVFP